MESLKCVFCDPEPPCILARNAHAYARFDKYPVSPGHTLVIPYRHVTDPFALTGDERRDLWELLVGVRGILEERFHPDGFNIGVNVGEAAGQTIPHLHVHLIPRYRGDMEDPRGGVRGVIPGKQRYSPGG